MGFLDKTALLHKEELKVERVDLSGGDFVFVRQMTAHEHSIYTQLLAKEIPVTDGKGEPTGEFSVVSSPEDWPSKLAACCLCDEKGELLLVPGDWETLSCNILGTKLDKIATAAVRLNRITARDQEKRVKNSKAGKAGASNSD